MTDEAYRYSVKERKLILYLVALEFLGWPLMRSLCRRASSLCSLLERERDGSS
jgi:hypothetical protein